MAKVSEILEMLTSTGYRVGDLRMMNGNHLVQKLRMDNELEFSSGKKMLLPDVHTRKSIGNLVAIKGLVIVPSIPWRPKVLKTKYEYSEIHGTPIPKSKVVNTGALVSTSLQSGDGIVYNSYNIGKIEVVGLDEPLVIIREIDMMSQFLLSDADEIELVNMSGTNVW